MTARATALLHSATLLAGDPHRGERLLRDALVRAYLAWGRIEREESPDTFVRRHIADTAVTGSRLFPPRRRRGQPTGPEDPQPTTPDADEPQPHLVRALAGLPDRQRVVLVLRYYEEMTVSEVADALGMRPMAVIEAAESAMRGLRERMRRRTPLPSSISDELSRHLRGLPPPAIDTRELIMLGRRSERRKQMSTVLAAAVLVVALCAAGSLIRLPEPDGVLPRPSTEPRPPVDLLPPAGRIDYLTSGNILVSEGRRLPVVLPTSQDAISRIDRVRGGWLLTTRSADRRDYSFLDDNGVRHDFNPSIAGAVVAVESAGRRLAVLHEQVLSILDLPSLAVVERLDASGVRASGLWYAGDHVVAYSQHGVNPPAAAVSGTVVWDRATGTRTVAPDVRVVDVSAIARSALVYTESAEQTCLHVASLSGELRPTLRVRCFSDRSVDPALFSPGGTWVVMPDPVRDASTGVKLRVYAVESLNPSVYSPPRTVLYGDGFWTVLGWEEDADVVVTPEPGRRGMRVLRCSLLSSRCVQYDLPADVVAVAVRSQSGT